MTAKVVEAVFFARYTASNFRALYGRLPTTEESTYTKDFLQVALQGGDLLGQVLAVPRTEGVSTDITYEWPSGSCTGKIEYKGVRWVLKWLTNSKPLPWTVGDITTPEISIPGDPTLQRPADADAVHAAINATGTEPWFIAVKLAGESRKLHVQTYFENPAPQFADRGVANLPKLVRDAIAALPPGDGSGAVRLPMGTHLATPPTPRAPKIVAAVVEALKRDPNVLLVGPPGTGKSVALDDLRMMYEGPPPGTVLFDPAVWGTPAWQLSTTPESRSVTLVFHPSYAYENFVAGLFPKSGSTTGIELVATPGPLLGLSHWIGKTDRRALLILDEFNRGQAAAIFGDTLGLLDGDKRSSQSATGAHISRPYPAQPMVIPESYRRDKAVPTDVFADEVRFPSTLHIVAAMNSTDRSVAPLDAAMRRRFTVIRIGPDYETLQSHLGLTPEDIEKALPVDHDLASWSQKDIVGLAARLLRALNDRIEFCLGEDFLLGHALVWGVLGTDAAETLNNLVKSVDSKVVSTLRMTFVDQDDALGAVLGVDDTVQVPPGQHSPSDRVAYWKAAPPALAFLNPRRLVVQPLSQLQPDGQLKALRSMMTA